MKFRKRLGTKWIGKRWRCQASSCVPDDGCAECEIYRCVGCKRLRHWSEGGTDSPVCDGCWYRRHKAKARKKKQRRA